jgi:hypothetical protein
VPQINLIKNIGFGEDATHLTSKNDIYNIPTGDLEKIIHPQFILNDPYADDEVFQKYFKQMLLKKIANRIRKIIRYDKSF